MKLGRGDCSERDAQHGKRTICLQWYEWRFGGIGIARRRDGRSAERLRGFELGAQDLYKKNVIIIPMTLV